MFKYRGRRIIPNVLWTTNYAIVEKISQPLFDKYRRRFSDSDSLRFFFCGFNAYLFCVFIYAAILIMHYRPLNGFWSEVFFIFTAFAFVALYRFAIVKVAGFLRRKKSEYCDRSIDNGAIGRDSAVMLIKSILIFVGIVSLMLMSIQVAVLAWTLLVIVCFLDVKHYTFYEGED